MKIGWKKVPVNPTEPVRKFSPGGPGVLTMEVKDELACRILVLEPEDGERYIHISCPFGEVEEEIHDEIHEKIEEELGQKVNLTTCAARTHYAPTLRESPSYCAFVVDQVVKGAVSVVPEDRGELSFRYQYHYFDRVGRSRISGQEAKNNFLETGSVYAGEKRLATLILYSSHPTTLNFNENYLSGAGPAVLLTDLEKKYPDEFFTYMIGAAGDISTRFTRPGQSYEDMLGLCALVEEEVERQLAAQADLAAVPLDEVRVEEMSFSVERGPRDLSEIDMSGDLTPRELETIEIAKEKNKAEDCSALPTQVPLQRVTLGGHIFICTPFELFSRYVDCIDKEKASIVNIANGAGGYMSPPGLQKMSFEVLSETIPSSSKLRLMEQLRAWGQ